MLVYLCLEWLDNKYLLLGANYELAGFISVTPWYLNQCGKKEYKAEGSKIKNDNKICSYLRFVWKAAKELLVVFYIVQLLK